MPSAPGTAGVRVWGLAPSLFNMFGVAGTNHIGAGAELQAKHGDGEFLGKPGST